MNAAFLKSATFFAQRLSERLDLDEAIAVAASVYAKHGIDADAIRDAWIAELIRVPVPAVLTGHGGHSQVPLPETNSERPRDASASAAGTFSTNSATAAPFFAERSE